MHRSIVLAIYCLVALPLLPGTTAAALPIAEVRKPTAKPSQKDKTKPSADAGKDKAKPEKTAFDYVLPGVDGKDVPMTSFKGKFVLLVNLARKSSYNAQLPALTKLSAMYKEKGLVVIGVPCNDFGAEEPGIAAEIQKDYADAKVGFQIMALSKLSGDAEIPLYLYLTKSKGAPPGGALAWNYTKFFIDKNGKVIARLGPDVAPDSPEMLATVEQVLGDRYKAPKKEDKGAGLDESDDDGG